MEFISELGRGDNTLSWVNNWHLHEDRPQAFLQAWLDMSNPCYGPLSGFLWLGCSVWKGSGLKVTSLGIPWIHHELPQHREKRIFIRYTGTRCPSDGWPNKENVTTQTEPYDLITKLRQSQKGFNDHSFIFLSIHCLIHLRFIRSCACGDTKGSNRGVSWAPETAKATRWTSAMFRKETVSHSICFGFSK